MHSRPHKSAHSPEHKSRGQPVPASSRAGSLAFSPDVSVRGRGFPDVSRPPPILHDPHRSGEDTDATDLGPCLASLPPAGTRLTSQTCPARAEEESLGLAQPLALGHTILPPKTAKGKLATINTASTASGSRRPLPQRYLSSERQHTVSSGAGTPSRTGLGWGAREQPAPGVQRACGLE